MVSSTDNHVRYMVNSEMFSDYVHDIAHYVP